MFAVFGMTEGLARKQAHRHVKLFTKNGKRTPEEYEQAVDDYVEKLMSGGRKVKLSPELSTPAIAEEWKTLAEKWGGVRLEVRINHPCRKVKKGGGVKIGRKWSLYIPGRNYSADAA